jgi:hypothetical protein
MDVTAVLDAPCPPEALYEWVADLGRYPQWLDIVPRAVPSGSAARAAGGGATDEAWIIDLRGRLGPFARSKRLRMVRTRNDAPKNVVFERHELDGRSHSPWLLEASVTELEATSSRLTMHLHYGGSLWGPLVERLLAEEIERSKPRLLALLRH